MRRVGVSSIRYLKRLQLLQLRRLSLLPQSGICQALPSTSTVAAFYGTNTLEYRRIRGEEHALLRPDTYVGPIELHENVPMWVYDNGRIVKRAVTFSPALLKIFDEILVNAADNKFRDPKGMTQIRVTVDRETNSISIWNNGRGISVEIHPEESMYIPTLIFGQMYTSSNYDDAQIKCVGGRNGFGAKLCNIFSRNFEVETVDGQRGLRFRQKWTHNMQTVEEPLIEATKEDEHTAVTFQPDLERFHLDRLTDDVCALFQMRAVEVAATLPDVSVFYNGEEIEISNFSTFMRHFSLEEEETPPLLDFRHSAQWHVGVSPSSKGYLHHSFVNNIATRKGGTHVDYVMDKLIAILRPEIRKRLFSDIRPQLIRDNVRLFVNCLIDNPTFASQTKESLSTTPSKFGSHFDFDKNALLQWADSSGLIDQIIDHVNADKNKTQRRKSRKTEERQLYDIAKLEDAAWAGGKSSRECSLVLTEGDSAKAVAVAGLQIVGREKFGVFPLKGKLLNVAELTAREILENVELKSLIRILGLEFDRKYESREERDLLRYGRIVLLTDQDEDGCHIRALVLNVFFRFWPALLNTGFVTSLHTPLIKARRAQTVLSFYSTREFEKWLQTEPQADSYTVKYYKGLGTSTSSEAKEYFRNLEERTIIYTRVNETDDIAMKVAFEKEQAEERKKWIAARTVQEENDQEKEFKKEVSLENFINTDLREYGIANLKRSIPNAMDGLKPSHRKIIHTLMKMPEGKEIKVSQLAGAVAQSQAYHHGETSLINSIVKLAQSFVGSNNLPLLEGIGQFGTRHEGGEDAASARYIYTKLSPITRLLFPKADDSLLEYCQEENLTVEPKWFCPIIPLILVNGTQGLATGYATRILNHDPRQVIDAVDELIEQHGKCEESMDINLIPHYEQFTGKIVPANRNQSYISGRAKLLKYDRRSSPIIEISELPVGLWTNRYKENVLRGLIEKGIIKNYLEQHTDNHVKFILNANGSLFPVQALSSQIKLLKFLKLRTCVSMNPVLFDHTHAIRTYESPAEIMREHFAVRRQLYEKRLQKENGESQARFRKIDNQIRFIEFILDGKLKLIGKSKEAIVDELKTLGFELDPVKLFKGQVSDMDYLLNTSIEQMTSGEIAKLGERRREREEKWLQAKKEDWRQAWRSELNRLAKAIDSIRDNYS